METLQTPRLILRPWTLNDVPAFARIYSDPQTMQYVGNGRPRTWEETVARTQLSIDHYARHGFGMGAVVDRGTGVVIGRCGLQYLPGTEDVEIGWLIERGRWGEGLATEAAAAWLAWGFAGPLRLRRIVAVANPENTASTRIMEKIGMVLVGPSVAYGQPVVLYEACAPPAR